MSIIRTHHCDGTAGTASSAAGEGFNTLNGTAPNYVAGGRSGTAIRIVGGAGQYYQDNLTNQFVGFYVRIPSTLTSGATLCMAALSGSACAAIVANVAGTLAIYSSLGSKQATSTTALTTNTWYRLEWNVAATTQELRIFSPASSATPVETVTGASINSPNQWRFGVSWASNEGGPFDLDEINVCDAWPNMYQVSGSIVRGVISGGSEIAATLRGSIQSGSEVAATLQQVIGGTVSSDVFPETFPYSLA